MLKTKCLELPLMTEQQIQACMDLANTVSSPQCRTEYLKRRFSSYHSVLTAHDEQGLAAFQLIQQFTRNDQLFLYLGPLFSQRKAYLPMFLAAFDRWLAGNHGRTVHLMAEIQNPEILLVFKTLFFHTSYPILHTAAIPPSVQETARIFASRFDHISQLDTRNLSTRGEDSLYQSKKGTEDILAWMRSRGVHVERGDSQILLLTAGGSLRERHRIKADLLHGKMMLRQWRLFRPIMLRKFKEGILHG
ncbi:hypothetical protein [Brevibacillus sp. H7]|uniref:hypothetical protein n=1 Tax=Brevibacillus sp. H7 TaxID=3349138 RepID=UPI0038033114